MLAEQLFVQPHSASELTERLVALGLLLREPSGEDRRRVELRLSAAAEDLLARMSAVHRGEVLRMRPALTQILEKLG